MLAWDVSFKKSGFPMCSSSASKLLACFVTSCYHKDEHLGFDSAVPLEDLYEYRSIIVKCADCSFAYF